MPRYHFTLTDGSTYLDPDGDELPDLDAAREAALGYLADMLKGRALAVWADGSMAVTVSDGDGLNLLMASVVVTNSPAVSS